MIFFFLLYKNIPHPVYPVCSTTTTANWEYSVFHALLLCNNTKIIEKFKILNKYGEYKAKTQSLIRRLRA
jgi:hypothetical protein